MKKYFNIVNIKKYISLIMLGAFMMLAVLFVLPNLPKVGGLFKTDGYKGIIELWNVESFEGGSGSRGDWLIKQTKNFSKKNKGLLFNVRTLTVEQLDDLLLKNVNFDIITFSVGVGEKILNKLNQINIDEDIKFLEGGKVDGVLKAVPFMFNAYATITFENDLPTDYKYGDMKQNLFSMAKQKRIGKTTKQLMSLGYGQNTFNQPLLAVSTFTKSKLSPLSLATNMTQYQAYESFNYRNLFVNLLGTLRDISRISQKIADGRSTNIKIECIDTFTDLVQYMAISSCSKIPQAYLQGFVNFMLTKNVQESLNQINMLSVLKYIKLYTSENLKLIEDGINNAMTLNVFTANDILQSLNELSLKFLQGSVNIGELNKHLVK